MSNEYPLVSVVVTCFNHARFLAESIESVLAQTYPNVELIVVDDGSTDDTRSIATGYAPVHYIFQQNSGLSSARNTGLKESSGDYILFLDADDRLLSNAVEINARSLGRDSALAFVSGHYRFTNCDGSISTDVVIEEVSPPYYQALLRGNYIGMHATVLYRREPLVEAGGFSQSLRACEDYDLYLRIARNHLVERHSEVVAEYRLHDTNMSANHKLMLESAIEVLNREKRRMPDEARLRQEIRTGMRSWRSYYGDKMLNEVVQEFRRGRIENAFSQLFQLMILAPRALAWNAMWRTGMFFRHLASGVHRAHAERKA